MKLLVFLFVLVSVLSLSVQAFKKIVKVNFIDEGIEEITLDVKTKAYECKDTSYKVLNIIPNLADSLYEKFLSSETPAGKVTKEYTDYATNWINEKYNSMIQNNQASFVVNDEAVDEKIRKNVKKVDVFELIGKRFQEIINPVYPYLLNAYNNFDKYYEIVVENIEKGIKLAQKYIVAEYNQIVKNYNSHPIVTKNKGSQFQFVNVLNKNIQDIRKWYHKALPATVQVENIVYHGLGGFQKRGSELYNKAYESGCDYFKAITQSNGLKVVEIDSKKETKAPRNTETKYFNCRLITKFGTKVDPKSTDIHEKVKEIIKEGVYSEVIMGYKMKDKQNRVYLKLVC
ncbi:hypothetical protein K502DRAFT_364800 [Neoconidiobolus thromboides FSU 785]|nr:hypothetical protein K502DRAFT_364800 [Neoconidiobolus thromboides FSU 785]